MNQIVKYPRTRHIEGSRIQAGDEDLQNERMETLLGRYLVLEEKVDGANCGISFDENGRLYLQSRGHYLNGGYKEQQFALFKTWASCHAQSLFVLLGSRYIMYGEWLFAKHTVFYDQLSHYFMEFDIFDKEEQCFLSTKRRRELLAKAPFIVSVRVLYEGWLNEPSELVSYLGRSAFKSADWETSLRQQCGRLGLSYEQVKSQTDASPDMEGIYIKVEGESIVEDRLKYVRYSFLNTIMDSETHWADRPIVPNQLRDGVNLYGEGEEMAKKGGWS